MLNRGANIRSEPAVGKHSSRPDRQSCTVEEIYMGDAKSFEILSVKGVHRRETLKRSEMGQIFQLACPLLPPANWEEGHPCGGVGRLIRVLYARNSRNLDFQTRVWDPPGQPVFRKLSVCEAHHLSLPTFILRDVPLKRKQGTDFFGIQPRRNTATPTLMPTHTLFAFTFETGSYYVTLWRPTEAS